jgi:membrane protein DedA with SNARE-associated domain
MHGHSILQAILHFVQNHETWGPFVLGLLAFGESIAIISLFVPATVIMVAMGGLIGLGGLELMPMCIGAATGAFLGDWLSYEIGRRYGHKVEKFWPFRNYPELFSYGERFFHKWGALSVVLGRFMGPARAIVPLTAGMSKMRRPTYLIANFLSAPVWAIVLLAPGALGLPKLRG